MDNTFENTDTRYNMVTLARWNIAQLAAQKMI
jgi:hypothetical protein